jgi:PAS domain S-box-containing protein
VRDSSRLERLYMDLPGAHPGSAGAYTVAALAVAGATFLRLAIDPFVTGVQFASFIPVVILVTFFLGARAGAFSIIASVLSAWQFVLQPRPAFHLQSRAELVSLIGFAVIAVICGGAVAVLRLSLAHMGRLRALETAIFESNPSAILVSDKDGRIIRLNRRAVELFGYPCEKLLNQPIDMLLPEERRKKEAAERAAFLADPDARDMGVADGLFARRADGTEFPVEVQIGPISKGGDARLIVNARDISKERCAIAALAESQRQQAIMEERQRGAEELRQVNAKLAKIIEAAPVAIWAIDPDDRISIWNPAVAKIYGHPASTIIGRPWREFATTRLPENTLSSDELLATAHSNGGFQNLELKRHGVDGAVHELSVSSAVLRNANGDAAGVLFIAHDVGETRQLEQKLRQAQKMEAIGQLTGGVAHDFNNLLGVIYGNLEMLGEGVEGEPDLTELVRDALTAAEHGAALTQQLLAFSRRQRLSPTGVDVGALVKETMEMLRRMVEASIEIATSIPPDLWKSRIDPDQLASALLNLVVNARDAMPAGGKISIAAENTELDAEYCRQHEQLEPGCYVRLSVTDNGTGMAKDIIERATEPFFTTKEVGQGSGLGLSMVYGFLKQSGGHLSIYSEPELGTTVSLYLPRLHDDMQEPQRPAETPALNSSAQEVILIVEDNDALRKLQIRTVRSLGYIAMEARHGAAALEILRTDERIDLLLTDVVLPEGVSGPALATAARELRPGLKLVFMSGYAPQDIMQNYNLSGARCLLKPFTRAALGHALQAELARDRPA